MRNADSSPSRRRFLSLYRILYLWSVAPALSNESHLRHAIVTCVVNYTSKNRKSFEVKLVSNKPQFPYLNTSYYNIYIIIINLDRIAASTSYPDKKQPRS